MRSGAQDFPEVARLYRLIEKDAVNLLVLYPEARSESRGSRRGSAPRGA